MEIGPASLKSVWKFFKNLKWNYTLWSKLTYVREAQTSTVRKYHVLESSVARQLVKETGFICTAVTHTKNSITC